MVIVDRVRAIGDETDVTLRRHDGSEFGQDEHFNVMRRVTEGSSTKELAAVNNRVTAYPQIPASTVASARIGGSAQ
jgi:hypothetical protein